ncbi:hypothetical protein, partial [Mycobacterium ulcerans]
LDRSPDSPCLHCGPNSAAPKIINPAHKPANQQRRSPDIAGEHNEFSQFFATPDSAENQENESWLAAKGIFSVLSTDKSASDYFNGAGRPQYHPG